MEVSAVPGHTDLWRAIEGETAPTGYRYGTWRCVPPSATLSRIAPLLGPAGITRIADITGLDWIGIPVYQAIRPNSRNFVVSAGKGLTRDQAKASAIMESLELFHAERINLPVVRATVGALAPKLDYDPYAIPRTSPSYLRDEMCLDWVEATNLSTGTPTWVPRILCDLDFTVREWPHLPMFLVSSNGLASGNTFGEAVVHALCEVIERDCRHRLAGVDTAPELSIRLDSVSAASASRLIERLQRAGMRVRISDLTGPTGLPCLGVLLDDGEVPVLYAGAGCHPRRTVALIRALTEAAQSRACYIAGSRDNLARHQYGAPSLRRRSSHVRDRPAAADRVFTDIPDVRLDVTAGGVAEIVRRLSADTGMPVLAVDLSRPDFGVPVVFVVAPGLRRPVER
jgi:ribosomal protein S12 methylthiotransferase accessory factor